MPRSPCRLTAWALGVGRITPSSLTTSLSAPWSVDAPSPSLSPTRLLTGATRGSRCGCCGRGVGS
eukprot:3400554-Rhodomonas_salina.1